MHLTPILLISDPNTHRSLLLLLLVLADRDGFNRTLSATLATGASWRRSLPVMLNSPVEGLTLLWEDGEEEEGTGEWRGLGELSCSAEEEEV